MLKLISILMLNLLIFCGTIIGQNNLNTKHLFAESSIDTTYFFSKKILAMHILFKTDTLRNQIFNLKDSIFTKLNKVSILEVIDNITDSVASIPTIPLDKLIILDRHELIIGLSKSIVSPYNIVIYDFKGNLLFKKKISSLNIILDSLALEVFKDSLPEFYSYVVDRCGIININGSYCIDMNFWHNLTEEQKQFIHTKQWLKQSCYFPELSSAYFGNQYTFNLKKYINFYSNTDPFYDLLIENEKIKEIVLNDELGNKVTIPVGCHYSLH